MGPSNKLFLVCVATSSRSLLHDKPANAAVANLKFSPPKSSFTPAEQSAALQMLTQRLDNGPWDPVNAEHLNQTPLDFGSLLNVVPPGFFDFEPRRLLRPFDAIAPPRAAAPWRTG